MYIHHVGNYVVLVPRDDPWRSMFTAAARFTQDYMAQRQQEAPQQREGLD